jgi:hypothetical protein
LVCDLLSRNTSTLPCIEDEVPQILIVLVPAGQYDAFNTLPWKPTSADTASDVAMDSRLM